jgi:hypothetical protein
MLTVQDVAAYWAGRRLPGTDYSPCVDKSEPDCFACGAWGKYDAEAWGRDHSWERGVSLEMAHVIPRSLGGPDELENLVLLCNECHLAAPDVAEARYMWQWLAAHPRTGSPHHLLLYSSFQEAVSSYTGAGREIVKALAGFSDDQRKMIADNVGKESTESLLGFSCHYGRGPVFSAATWQAVFEDLLCRVQGTLF